LLLTGSFLLGFSADGGAADTIPGSANSAKLGEDKKRQEILRGEAGGAPLLETGESGSIAAPEGADKIAVRIEGFKVNGITVYGDDEIQALYAEFQGKDVPLSVLWEVANRITQKYHEDGYFLARAAIPPQELANNIPQIDVVEGYISEVAIDKRNESMPDYLMAAVEELKAQQPIRVEEIEEFLMLLNNLPRAQFRGVLEPDPQARRGAIKLNVIEDNLGPTYHVSVSNSGSKYTGPGIMDAGFSGKIVPYQEISLGISKSLPFEEMSQVNMGYGWNVSLRDRVDLAMSYSSTFPGDALRENELESRTQEFSGKWTHSFLRLRQQVIEGDVEAGLRRSDSKVLGLELSKDRVRYLTGGVKASMQDSWLGVSSADMHVTRGLGVLGASEKTAINTSRENSGGDFTKVEATVSRLQLLGQEWMLQAAATGQVASRSLPSSEEFGFGGMTFGRAYDSSEISGDHGVAGLLELRYQGVPPLKETATFTPYVFYDAGKVWNKNTGQETNISASSAGMGLYVDALYGIHGNIFLAKPLTRAIETPIRAGRDDWQVRFQVQATF